MSHHIPEDHQLDKTRPGSFMNHRDSIHDWSTWRKLTSRHVDLYNVFLVTTGGIYHVKKSGNWLKLHEWKLSFKETWAWDLKFIRKPAVFDGWTSFFPWQLQFWSHWQCHRQQRKNALRQRLKININQAYLCIAYVGFLKWGSSKNHGFQC